LNPGFLLLFVIKCKLSYPSDTSNAKADRNDKAFLLGELLEERVDLNPRVPFYEELSYPSGTSKAK
jgi:hypothetical protein